MDTVTFDNSGVGVNGGTVTLVGNLAPSGTAGYAGSAAPPTTTAVTVNTSGTYTFTGTGSIVGATSLSMSGGGTLNIANTNSFGGIDPSGNPYGVVSIHQGTINVLPGGILTNNTTEIDIGDTPGQTGTLSMSGGTAMVPLGANGNSGVNVGINGGTGVLTMTGSSLLDASASNGYINLFAIGFNNGASGTSGTVTVGGNSTLRVDNGSAIGVGDGGIGTLTVRDQALVVAGAGNGFGFNSSLQLGLGGGTGTVNLNGGTLNVDAITNDNTAGSTGTIYFNGGTLQANAASGNFIASGGTSSTMTAYVRGGGTKIDSNSYAITVSQDLLHDPALGGTVDGGLTKLGDGTLVLAGTNSYTGVTNVTAGTLQLGAGANLSANDVNVSAGATLDLNDNIVSIGALNGPATAMVLLGSSTSSPAHLSIGDNGDSGTYAGSISGIGGLSKVGTAR